jgi:DNA polymerase elongation subunit (family B)
MKKIYGKRIRLTPQEEQVIYSYRKGKVSLKEAVQPEIKFPLPKVLVLDVETSPLSAYVWRLTQDYIQPSNINNDSGNYFMLSWSAKWLFSDEVLNDVLTPEEALSEDDYRISKTMWELVNEADIVVTHNGRKFDHKFLNMRWLVNGIKPPTHYKTIDTYLIAKQSFLLPSYKLDYIAKDVLGIDGKFEHEGMGMWKKCMMGNAEALERMSLYNDQDVRILEDVYLIFRPWIKNHPNIGLFAYADEPVCHVCGSTDLEEEGEYRTSVSIFKTHRCKHCESLSRQRDNELPKHIRKHLLTGVPGDR